MVQRLGDIGVQLSCAKHLGSGMAIIRVIDPFMMQKDIENCRSCVGGVLGVSGRFTWNMVAGWRGWTLKVQGMQLQYRAALTKTYQIFFAHGKSALEMQERNIPIDRWETGDVPKMGGGRGWRMTGREGNQAEENLMDRLVGCGMAGEVLGGP